MSNPTHNELSRRERQIMDVIYRLGEATVADVVQHLSDPPGYNSVRVTMRILEKKGHIVHKTDGQRYVYAPTVPADRAKGFALEHLLTTFFEGSAPQVVSTLLDVSGPHLSEADLDELSQMIDAAKRARNA